MEPNNDLFACCQSETNEHSARINFDFVPICKFHCKSPLFTNLNILLPLSIGILSFCSITLSASIIYKFRKVRLDSMSQDSLHSDNT